MPWNPCLDTKKKTTTKAVTGLRAAANTQCSTRLVAPPHVQSLLSVRGGRAVRLSPQVPADAQRTPLKYASARRRRGAISGGKRAAGAKTHRRTLQSGEAGWSLRAWQTLKRTRQCSVLPVGRFGSVREREGPSAAVPTLSPGGPGGPSFPELP